MQILRSVNLRVAVGVLGILLGSIPEVWAQVTSGDAGVQMVQPPVEISGVAAIKGGFLIVANNDPDSYFTFLDNKPHKIWREMEDGERICDPESIDVGYGPKGEEIYVILGEDFGRVHIRGASTIQLPDDFSEQCGRGAEGVTVRWANNGWDLAVLWEGGIPDKKHQLITNESEENCKSSREKCSRDKIPENAKIALYHLSKEGENLTPRPKLLTIETADLLQSIDPEEAFRATDLAWYKGNFLVLLGSTPMRDNSDKRFRHTWIQGFDINGNIIKEWRMELESKWGRFRVDKNWEGLDTTLDESRLIMVYDHEENPTELVAFYPEIK